MTQHNTGQDPDAGLRLHFCSLADEVRVTCENMLYFATTLKSKVSDRVVVSAVKKHSEVSLKYILYIVVNKTENG